MDLALTSWVTGVLETGILKNVKYIYKEIFHPSQDALLDEQLLARSTNNGLAMPRSPETLGIVLGRNGFQAPGSPPRISRTVSQQFWRPKIMQLLSILIAIVKKNLNTLRNANCIHFLIFSD